MTLALLLPARTSKVLLNGHVALVCGVAKDSAYSVLHERHQSSSPATTKAKVPDSTGTQKH